MAFSRLYLYVHYPSDVFGGIFLGIFAFLITIKTYNILINKNI
jgi:undecaprenyl-diphosphatase